MADMLFEGYPDPPEAAPLPPVRTPREARRLTLENRRARQADAIARGVHPLNGQPLLGEHTCGDCANRVLKRLGKAYPKCIVSQVTGGPATDVKASWPACVKWEAR